MAAYMLDIFLLSKSWKKAATVVSNPKWVNIHCQWECVRGLGKGVRGRRNGKEGKERERERKKARVNKRVEAWSSQDYKVLQTQQRNGLNITDGGSLIILYNHGCYGSFIILLLAVHAWFFFYHQSISFFEPEYIMCIYKIFSEHAFVY